MRESLRQVQFSCAVARCEHYAGLNVLDRDSSVWLLHKVLRLKQHYSAGTLKAILANAVTTAVGFHRAKACQSSICPFCDLNLDETLEHIFDHCPAWASLRSRFNAQEHAALPSHTRLPGVVSLQQSTLDALQPLSVSDTLCDAARLPCPSDVSLETWANGLLVVYIDGACLNQNSHLWKRAGYGVAYDPLRQHTMTVSCPLLELEQTAQCAEFRAFLHVLAQDSRPLLIHTDSASVVQVFELFKNGGVLPLDGDNLDISTKIFVLLGSRSSAVQVVKVKGHSSNPLNDAADGAAKHGASMHHTASFCLPSVPIGVCVSLWSPGSSFFCPFCWSDAELLRLGICCPSRSAPELRVRSLPLAMLEMDIFSTAIISMACACSFPRLSLFLAVSDTALASSATMPSLGMCVSSGFPICLSKAPEGWSTSLTLSSLLLFCSGRGEEWSFEGWFSLATRSC